MTIITIIILLIININIIIIIIIIIIKLPRNPFISPQDAVREFVDRWEHHKVNFVTDSGFGSLELMNDLKEEVL
jgi:hypothetical protein